MMAVLRTSLMLLSMNNERSATRASSRPRCSRSVRSDPLASRPASCRLLPVLSTWRSLPSFFFRFFVSACLARLGFKASSLAAASNSPRAALTRLARATMLASASLKMSIWTLSGAVGSGQISRSLWPRRHLTDIADAYVATLVPRHHDRVGNLAQVLVLVEGPHHVFGPPFGQRATSQVDVLLEANRSITA